MCPHCSESEPKRIDACSASGAFRILQPLAKRANRDGREHFWILSLAADLSLIGKPRVVSIGSASACIVHPRELFSFAIRDRAHRLIVAHNHPSGSVEPSTEDLSLTRRLVACGDLLGIPVVDHLICTGVRFYSFAENGRIRE